MNVRADFSAWPGFSTRTPEFQPNMESEKLRNLPPHGRKRRDRAALLTQEGKTLTVVGSSSKLVPFAGGNPTVP
jgi:hypothetical protein